MNQEDQVKADVQERLDNALLDEMGDKVNVDPNHPMYKLGQVTAAKREQSVLDAILGKPVETELGEITRPQMSVDELLNQRMTYPPCHKRKVHGWFGLYDRNGDLRCCSARQEELIEIAIRTSAVFNENKSWEQIQLDGWSVIPIEVRAKPTRC